LVFTVRCFKCGEKDVRLIMGGRSIIHARCHECGANLLAEVMEFEEQVMGASDNARPPDEPATSSGANAAQNGDVEQESSSTLEEDTQARQQS
jgi:DNA-directed RNA polymerase subunit N (RpoN/RPB10)